MISNALKHIYRFIRELVSKYPLETTLLSLLLSLIITTAAFQSVLRQLLTIKLKLWCVLIGIGSIGFLAILRITRRLLKKLLYWRFLGILILILMVTISAVHLATQPNLKCLRVIESHLDFPGDYDKMNKFTVSTIMLLLLHDAFVLNSEFPDLFIEKAPEKINDIMSIITSEADSLFESMVKQPSLRVLLSVNNGLETPTTVYRATGELRVGDPDFYLGGKIRRIEGRTIVTDEYMEGSRKYEVNFKIAADKLRLPAGSGAEQLELIWEIPEDIAAEQWLRDVLLFELRRLEFMDYHQNDLERELRKIHSKFIERDLNAPPCRTLGFSDYKLIGIQADIVLYHTFGELTYRKTFAIGLAEGVKPSDIVKVWN